MNTQIFGNARLVAVSLSVAAALTVEAQTLPYWDVTPGAGANCAYVPFASDAGGYGSGVLAKNGAFFEASECYPDPSVVYEWNKCTNWAPIGLCDANGIVYTMCIGGNYLYVGGSFTNIGGQGPFTNIAKYDLICGGWSQVGDNSITASVQAIAVDAVGNVYAGMMATTVDGNWPYGQLDTNIFKMWNGTAWQAVGGGLYDTALRAHNGTSLSGVTALAADGTNIYVGGDFDGSTSVSSYELIKWNGSSFQQMVSSPTMWDWDSFHGEYVAGPSLTQIAVSGSNVFVVGSFSRSDGDGANDPVGLARFSTNGGWCGDTNMSLIWSQSVY